MRVKRMPTDPIDPDIAQLIDRRLVFVMGKGGTGKTTLAAALAFAAEAAGKRVLLVETEESEAIGRLFGKTGINETPLRVSRRIFLAKVIPKAEMTAYAQYHIRPAFVAKRVTNSRLFDYLATAAPGLKEVMTLGRLWRWEGARDKNSRPVFDIVIVDSPATGHVLSLLRLPQTLIRMIRVGPIVSQVQRLDMLLKDENRTALALVSLPEEIPVKESVELMTTARDEIGMPVRTFFLNGVYPDIFQPRTSEALYDLLFSNRADKLYAATGNPAALDAVLVAARHQLVRRQIHEKYIATVNKAAECPVVEIPFFFTNDLGLDDIRQIAGKLSVPEKETGGMADA